MNLQEFPQPVKNDIEDQSLSILEHILALNVGINIKEHIRIMKDIEKELTL
ncbi:MAG: hypothetical protein IMZ43_04350 [Thermoplasmata archaeon]|nr:hypothetical protein [Thermoplasmata archaeon]